MLSVLAIIAQVGADILSDITFDGRLNRPIGDPIIVFNSSYAANKQRVLIHLDKDMPNNEYYNVFEAFGDDPVFLVSSNELYNKPAMRVLADLRGKPIGNVNRYTGRRVICSGNTTTDFRVFINERTDVIQTPENITVYRNWLEMKVFEMKSYRWINVYLREDKARNADIYMRRRWGETLLARIRPIRVRNEPYAIRRFGWDNNFAVGIAAGVDAAFIMLVTAFYAR